MLDVQTYGISVTTLEQVFLEIGHDPNPRPKVSMSTDSHGSRPASAQNPNHLDNLIARADEAKVTPYNGQESSRKNNELTAQEVSQPSDRKLITENNTPGSQLRKENPKHLGKADSFLPPITSPKSPLDFIPDMDNLNKDLS